MYILDITVQKDLIIYKIEPMFTYKASHLYMYIFVYFLNYWTYHLYAPTSQLVYLITLEQFCAWSHIPLNSNISLSVAAAQQRIKPFSTVFCPVITLCARYWVFQEIK